jgi:hypothetical protein
MLLRARPRVRMRWKLMRMAVLPLTARPRLKLG